MTNNATISSIASILMKRLFRASSCWLSEMPTKKPDEVGPYQVESCLGLGGMGAVYQARHKDTGEQVAVKTVLSNHRIVVECIRREISALARIDHPGIIPIREQGIMEDGCPWYSMPIVQGETLRSLLNRLWPHNEEIISPSESIQWWTTAMSSPSSLNMVTISRQRGKTGPRWENESGFREQYQELLIQMSYLCETLAYLHGQGMVHRDIKPENIMIRSDGMPVLMDFGLTRQLTGEISREILDFERNRPGTILYMAPELINGELADARSDIYAIGCILYELVAGKPPFTFDDILTAHRTVTPPRFSKVIPGIPKSFDSMVMKLLAENPSERIGYAQDVSRSLQSMCKSALPSYFEGLPEPGCYLFRTQCIGRENLLNEVQNMLASASKDIEPKRLVTISGESGSGKTLILKAVGSWAFTRNLKILTGECREKMSIPLHVFQNTLQEIVDFCRGGEAETHRIFGPEGYLLEFIEPSIASLPGLEKKERKEGEALTPTADPYRYFEILLNVLEQYADRDHLLILLDDLHWADSLTLDFLHFYLRSGREMKIPLSLVGTYRIEEVDEQLQKLIDFEEVISVTVPRMNRPMIRNMVREMLSMTTVPRVLTSYLLKSSEGLPLYVSEFLTMLIDEGILKRQRSGKWVLDGKETSKVTLEEMEQLCFPESLEGLIFRRFSYLDNGVAQLARIASIQTSPLDYELLKDMFRGNDDLFLASLTTLLARLILRTEKSEYHFGHDQVRQMIYKNLPRSEIIELHLQAARLLEKQHPEKNSQIIGQIGNHLALAEHYEDARCSFKSAAELARKENNRQQSVIWFSRASATITVNRNNVKTAAPEKAKLLFEAGCDAYLEGEARQAQSLFEQSCKYFQRSIKLFRSIDENKSLDLKYKLMVALRGYGLTYYLLWDWKKAQYYLKKVIKEFATLPVHRQTPADFAANYENLGLTFHLKGDDTQAITYIEKAKEIFNAHHLEKPYRIPTMLVHLAVCYSSQYRNTESLALYQEAEKLYREAKMTDSLRYGDLLNNMSSCYNSLGKTEQALDLSLQALSIKSRIASENHPKLATVHQNLSAVYLKKWDIPNALKHVKKAHSMKRVKFPDNNPELASTLSDIGLIKAYQDSQGKVRRGFFLADQAIKIMAESEIKKEINIPEMYRNRGLIQYFMGLFLRADEDFRVALKISDAKNNHAMKAETQALLALSLARQGRIVASLQMAQRNLCFMEKCGWFEPWGLTLLAIALDLQHRQTPIHRKKTVSSIIEITSLSPIPENYYLETISWAQQQHHLHALISGMYSFGQYLQGKEGKEERKKGRKMLSKAESIAEKYDLCGILLNL